MKGCLEAPCLLTARVFSIYVPHFQGIWEIECLFPRRECLLFHHLAAASDLFTITDGTRQSKSILHLND